MNYNIKGHTGLYKDSESSGIISRKDNNHLNRVNASNRINTIINDIEYLKEEMFEIKLLLKDIKNNSN